MILSQFEEAVWHRRGSDCDIAEAWHHGGEIVSAIKAVLEFGEVTGYMLVVDGAVSASDSALDVAEGGVDPPEGRVQGGLATGSSDDRLVDAAGAADPSEAVQAVTDNGAGGMEIALRQGRDFRHGGSPSRGATSSGWACPLVWFRPTPRSASCQANRGFSCCRCAPHRDRRRRSRSVPSGALWRPAPSSPA